MKVTNYFQTAQENIDMVKEGCSGSKSIEIPMAPINKVG
jgi:hypothetical protein